jgi:hypothetical protein
MTQGRVLSIDPGPMVGWADGQIGPRKFRLLDWGQTPLDEFLVNLHEHLVSPIVCPYNVLLVEKFTLMPGKASRLAGSTFPEVETIGGVKLCARLASPQPEVVLQDPWNLHVGQRTAPKEVRDILDTLPRTHGESHARSAILQLWAFHRRSFRHA